MLYLDTSALVKTVRPERETAAFLTFLRDNPTEVLLTSQLTITELARAVTASSEHLGAAALTGRLQLVRDRLRGLQLVAMTRDLLEVAGHLDPPRLRTLDAIHLATALQFRDELTALVAYDRRMTEAARREGLRVLAPGAM